MSGFLQAAEAVGEVVAATETAELSRSEAILLVGLILTNMAGATISRIGLGRELESLPEVTDL